MNIHQGLPLSHNSWEMSIRGSENENTKGGTTDGSGKFEVENLKKLKKKENLQPFLSPLHHRQKVAVGLRSLHGAPDCSPVYSIGAFTSIFLSKSSFQELAIINRIMRRRPWEGGGGLDNLWGTRHYELLVRWALREAWPQTWIN